MEDIKKLQELLDLIKDKTKSTTAEKLAMIGVVNEKYKEVVGEEIIDMLLERIEWQIEGEIREMECADLMCYDNVPF